MGAGYRGYVRLLLLFLGLGTEIPWKGSREGKMDMKWGSKDEPGSRRKSENELETASISHPLQASNFTDVGDLQKTLVSFVLELNTYLAQELGKVKRVWGQIKELCVQLLPPPARGASSSAVMREPPQGLPHTV